VHGSLDARIDWGKRGPFAIDGAALHDLIDAMQRRVKGVSRTEDLLRYTLLIELQEVTRA
jgi:hypothetical protein